EQNVPVDPSFLTFQSLDPTVANVDPNGIISATGRGVGVVTAAHDGIRAATGITVGEVFTRQHELLEAGGLFAQPTRAFLDQPGATYNLRIASRDLTDLTPASTGTRYFSGNDAVATVNSDGVVTATGLGQTTITAINGPAETLITITVQTPANTTATIG